MSHSALHHVPALQLQSTGYGGLDYCMCMVNKHKPSFWSLSSVLSVLHSFRVFVAVCPPEGTGASQWWWAVMSLSKQGHWLQCNVKTKTMAATQNHQLWCLTLPAVLGACVCATHSIPFTIWIKISLVSVLTFRPRCTWAVRVPSCGAATGTGPDRCSAGTGLASAWTPGYNTGCQLVVQTTALLEKLRPEHNPLSSILTLRKEHTLVVMRKNLLQQLWEHVHGSGWWVRTHGIYLPHVFHLL